MNGKKSKLQSDIEQFRLDKGYRDVLVLCNKLTYNYLYEDLDNVRYATNSMFDDGVYYLAKDENFKQNLYCTEFTTTVDKSCIRGGSSDISPEFNPRNYRPNIDKIMQNIKVSIDNGIKM